MSTARWEHFQHQADIGVRGLGSSVETAFEQAAGQLEPRVRLAKLNTEMEQAIASQFNIRSIPTLALFRNGQEVARQECAIAATDIIRWVQAHT